MNLPASDLVRAADAIRRAEALLICAGAGMGVDSGLPDFRGDQGFWKAYPLYAKLKLNFADMANPDWFERDPEMAWGFYGHRLNLYRATQPHAGFSILKKWAESKPMGHFIFTSNVDGQFQCAGFAADRVVEAHGSIHFLQCLNACGAGIFAADAFTPEVDIATMRARAPLPCCPRCGGLARPNILMFGDGGWDNTRSKAVSSGLNAWLREMPLKKVAIVECGAGGAIPTVRFFSEQIAQLREAILVRINPRESDVPEARHVSLEAGALHALSALDLLLSTK
ncbi:MAG TPA: Sir2 family NAD-dependent protein deacetylase [Planctomycetota bacterium]|nr:Sir2 family NAD-dependent protein deacetylase [Planctomycetota bacterium]